jgi:hypothetical protein
MGLFHEYKIAYLSADREFLGHDWLQYLLSQPIFKSRGFNLEDTHLIDSERLSRLLALLTIALS